MKDKKINLKVCSKVTLRARLFVITREYNRKIDLYMHNREDFMSYTRKSIKENFVVNKDISFDAVTDHLALFLLGDENNIFDKTLNKQ